MAIAKIQNATNQYIPVSDRDGNIVSGKALSISESKPLSELIELSPNAEFIVVDFFGAVWIRFDGLSASSQNGHKFSEGERAEFSRDMFPFVTVAPDGDTPVAAFASQLGCRC